MMGSTQTTRPSRRSRTLSTGDLPMASSNGSAPSRIDPSNPLLLSVNLMMKLHPNEDATHRQYNLEPVELRLDDIPIWHPDDGAHKGGRRQHQRTSTPMDAPSNGAPGRRQNPVGDNGSGTSRNFMDGLQPKSRQSSSQPQGSVPPPQGAASVDSWKQEMAAERNAKRNRYENKRSLLQSSSLNKKKRSQSVGALAHRPSQGSRDPSTLNEAFFASSAPAPPPKVRFVLWECLTFPHFRSSTSMMKYSLLELLPEVSHLVQQLLKVNSIVKLALEIITRLHHVILPEHQRIVESWFL